MVKTSTKWAIALTAVVAAGGLAFAVPAMAQGNGFIPRPMMGGGMMAVHNTMAPLMSQMPQMHDQVISEAADLLGMTADELADALAYRSLADLAAEKGIALEEVEQVMTDKMKSFLDRAVADGTLTQEQADQMLKYHAEYSGSCHSGRAGSMMGGAGGMMRGAGPMFRSRGMY